MNHYLAEIIDRTPIIDHSQQAPKDYSDAVERMQARRQQCLVTAHNLLAIAEDDVTKREILITAAAEIMAHRRTLDFKTSPAT